MNFGQITKQYAWAFGLAEDITEERFKTLLGPGERVTEKRMEKASERFDQLRAQIGKRWKIDGYEGEPRKRSTKKKPKK